LSGSQVLAVIAPDENARLEKIMPTIGEGLSMRKPANAAELMFARTGIGPTDADRGVALIRTFLTRYVRAPP